MTHFIPTNPVTSLPYFHPPMAFIQSLPLLGSSTNPHPNCLILIRELSLSHHQTPTLFFVPSSFLSFQNIELSRVTLNPKNTIKGLIQYLQRSIFFALGHYRSLLALFLNFQSSPGLPSLCCLPTILHYHSSFLLFSPHFNIFVIFLLPLTFPLIISRGRAAKNLQWKCKRAARMSVSPLGRKNCRESLLCQALSL